MAQNALLSAGWIVDEPRFLEFQPGFVVEVVHAVFVGHVLGLFDFLTDVTQKMPVADIGAALTLRPLPKGEGT